MNLKELKEIFRLVEKTDFNEVEIVRENWRVRIERSKNSQSLIQTIPVNSGMPVGTMHVSSEGLPSTAGVSTAATNEAEATEKQSGQFVTSPFVGTFYTAPSPEAELYAQVGQSVKKGQTLCIIEAMKLMNEIEAECDGKIAEIYPSNGQAVEFGEKLFRII